MEFIATAKFKKQFKRLPQRIRKTAKKQLGLLLSNPEGETYILRNIGTHDILNTP